MLATMLDDFMLLLTEYNESGQALNQVNDDTLLPNKITLIMQARSHDE